MIRQTALFLILRRMRTPLIGIIVTYAITVTGLTLIPGIVVDGQTHYLGFFHAFYIISYTATTIGFGEIPYAFSDAQRLWVTFSIYLSVIAWLYGIGTLITLLQDSTFRGLLRERRFTVTVRRITEPFYIICGYGDTGVHIVQILAQRGVPAVVIDDDANRINDLAVSELPFSVPGLHGDARSPDNLITAGIHHSHCAGVVAVTNEDHTNLKIAITVKLLRPGLRVICRAQTHDEQNNMASFGTNVIVNQFELFAERLAMAIHSPDLYLLNEWLTEVPGMPLPPRIDPPHGTWILCGYGRFGKEVHRFLEYEDVKTVIIEMTPELVDAPAGTIKGRGTEAITLRTASIEEAAGLVAGTDDDANNLSIVMTARALNFNLFIAARQNRRENASLFESAKIDLVMERARVVGNRMLTVMDTPIITEFLHHVRHQNNEWARKLIDRIAAIADGVVPELWTLSVTPANAPAISMAIERGHPITLGHVWRDPCNREVFQDCIPLMLVREGTEYLLPDENEPLQQWDQILWTGPLVSKRRMQWVWFDDGILRYLETGHAGPDGWIWRKLARAKN